VADQIAIQLIEADVDIGFALVDEAKAYRAAGQSQFSVGAIKEAARVLVAIEERLQRLGEYETRPFVNLIRELRKEIAAVQQEIAK
jgi:hypothetical protein